MPRRLPGEHPVALEGPDIEAAARKAALGRHVIAVGPDADLRVVGSDRIVVRVLSLECIQEPPARERIGATRYRDALQVLVDRELTHEPTIGEAVVADDGVAVVVRLTASPKALPQRVDLGGAGEQIPALVVDGKGGVHHLDVVVRPDGADGVGRQDAGGADPVDIGADRGCGQRGGGRCRFQRGLRCAQEGIALFCRVVPRRGEVSVTFQILLDPDGLALAPDLHRGGQHERSRVVGDAGLRNAGLPDHRCADLVLSPGGRCNQRSDRENAGGIHGYTVWSLPRRNRCHVTVLLRFEGWKHC